MEEKRINNSEQVKKKVRKKKIRLKKSIRRTAGALLLTTSIIVAAIPVGNVSAVTAHDGSGGDGISGIPLIDDICDDAAKDPADQLYYHVTGSVQPADTSLFWWGFPGDETFDDDFINPYFRIAKDGYTTWAEKTVPVFKLCRCATDGGTTPDGIWEYIPKKTASGYSAPDGGRIDLGDHILYNNVEPTFRTESECGGVDHETTATYHSYYSDSTHRFKYVETLESLSDGVNSYKLMRVKVYKVTLRQSGSTVDFEHHYMAKAFSQPNEEIIIDSSEIENEEGDIQQEEPVVTFELNPSSGSLEDSETLEESEEESNEETENEEIVLGEEEEEAFLEEDLSLELEINESEDELIIDSDDDVELLGDPGDPTPTPPIEDLELIEDFYSTNDLADVGYLCDEAFMNVDNITSVVLPPNSGEVGISVFEDCNNLKSVEFTQESTVLGAKAFKDCISLDELFLPSNIPLNIIGDGAFANTGITQIVLPNTVKQVGSGAFYGCRFLDSRVDNSIIEPDVPQVFALLNNTEVVLGDYAFAKCENLQEMKLPDKMIQIGKGKANESGYGVFAGCENLQHVSLPQKFGTGTQNQISGGFFENTPCLLWVKYPDRKSFDTDHEFITENNYGLPFHTDPVTGEPFEKNHNVAFAIYGEDDLNNVTNPAYKYAEDNGNTYMYGKWPNDVHYILVLNGYRFTFTNDADGNGVIEGIAVTNSAQDELKIPKNIGGNEMKIIKGNSLTWDDDAQTGVPTKITIPDNIIEIGNNTFKNIGSDLKEVEINTAGISIGDSCFEGNAGLEHVSITQVENSAGDILLGKSSFANNPMLEQVEFAQLEGSTGSLDIGAKCFLNDANLEEVRFLDDDFNGDSYNYLNVTNIGEDAFRTGGDGLTFVGKIEKGYAPYDFAIDPSSKVSSKSGAYIVYKSGNPQNLICKYNEARDAVMLYSYPDDNTPVGEANIKVTEPDGSTNTYDVKTVHDIRYIYDNYGAGALSSNMVDIYNSAKEILIPDGITSIDKAYSNNEQNVQYAELKMYDDESKKDVSVTYCEDGSTHSVKRSPLFQNVKKLNIVQFGNEDGSTETITKVPDYAFKNNTDLIGVNFLGDISSMGSLPFWMEKENEAKGTPGSSKSKLQYVYFGGETKPGTVDNPDYSCSEKGLLIEDTGEDKTLLECLPSRGFSVIPGDSRIIDIDETVDLTDIVDEACRDCDGISTAYFAKQLIDGTILSSKIKDVPESCFEDCDNLLAVDLPATVKSIEENAFKDTADMLTVTIRGKELDIDDTAFGTIDGHPSSPTVYSYEDSAAQRYVNRMRKKGENIEFKPIGKTIDVYFKYYDYVNKTYVDILDKPQVVEQYGKADEPSDEDFIKIPKTQTVDGITYTLDLNNTWVSLNGESIKDKIIIDPTVFIAKYTTSEPPSPTPTPTDKPTPTGTPSPTGKPSSSSTSKSGSSSSTSKSKSSSSSGKNSSSGKSGNSSSASMAFPIYISSQGTQSLSRAGLGANDLVSSTVYVDSNPGSASSLSKASGSNNNSGKTSVYSDADGISDTGKMSASVNGSSDNFVVKITKTAEADEMGEAALKNAFGDDISAFRYLPIDISLYDSTGTNKINPVPEGVSVSVTIPIPDDLAIYGGNAKVASTRGGVLEKMQPRFTVIDEVPCMTFTCTHFSPYLVYVDTANLTDAGISDASPKTADGIHPKWFLCIGLAAIAVVLFLKRDPEEYLKKISM